MRARTNYEDGLGLQAPEPFFSYCPHPPGGLTALAVGVLY